MSLSLLIWQKKNVQQYKNILFNELLTPLIKDMVTDMSEKHNDDTTDTESIPNATNKWDFGTYLSHHNPQFTDGVNKRVFTTNASEMRYIAIPFNELLHARNDVPDDICQFVRNTAIIMFEAHGGDTFYAEFDGTRSVKVRTECSDGTDNKVIASCTKIGAFTPTLQNTTVVCTRG